MLLLKEKDYNFVCFIMYCKLSLPKMFIDVYKHLEKNKAGWGFSVLRKVSFSSDFILMVIFFFFISSIWQIDLGML